MAWLPTIKTWVDNTVMTANDLNTEIRDRFDYLYQPTHRRFRAHSSVGTSIPTGSWSYVQLDSIDTDPNAWGYQGYHMAPWGIGATGGWFHVNITAYFIDPINRVRMHLYKNASEIYIAEAAVMSERQDVVALSLSDLVYCNGNGDYLSLVVYHTSGSNRTVRGIMSAFYVGKG